jgi:transposase
MKHCSEVFVGIDTSKLTNAVAVAEAGRKGEIRFLGTFPADPASTRKWIGRLAAKHAKVSFCYEAGPTGYGLYRLIRELGYDCLLAAPSLIPRRPGDRVKTNRRDAQSLAQLLRAGDLVEVFVPDTHHEAIRDLSRAREAARQDVTRKRQQVTSLLLRLGIVYPGKKTWGKAHRAWLARLKLVHRQHRIVVEELLIAEGHAHEQLARLEGAIRDAVPDWRLHDLVAALMAMRGLDLVGAVTLAAELGDLSRFQSPRELMAYLGLVPSERSTGEAVKRGGITKAGNRRARRMLVEAAWSYRHPPRTGAAKRALIAAQPEAVRAIAWTAQMRLSSRFRRLTRGGKRPVIAATAIARELAGFVWAMARQMAESRA